jgi:signal transduction histidine kinase/CheY-like chemotaxis protein
LERDLAGSGGFEVIPARDGAHALAEIERTELDLVVTDVRMPGATGLEILARTKVLWPDTEVIVITGHADFEAALECIRGGAADLIEKPVRLAELRRSVERALERRRLRLTAALSGLGQRLLANEEPQRLPELIVQLAIELLGAEQGALLLARPDQKLYLAHAIGVAPEAAARMLEVVESYPRIKGRAEPILGDGFELGPNGKRLLCPLRVGARFIGLLSVARAGTGRAFSHQDLERARVLAPQVVMALENARLIHQLVSTERLVSVGQLASGVGHEINSPLTYLLAGHEFLKERVPSLLALVRAIDAGSKPSDLRSALDLAGGLSSFEEITDVVSEIGEGARRIRDIVGDLRIVARREDAGNTLVDLDALIRSALRIVGAPLRELAVVTSELSGQAMVIGSPSRLTWVFVSLLMNAAQALAQFEQRSKREVRVSSSLVGSSVVARVSDNGPGIPGEHLERIFDPFFSTKPPGVGTGLGLTLSRDIVRALGGELEVESTLGEGATFVVKLPLPGAVLRT